MSLTKKYFILAVFLCLSLTDAALAAQTPDAETKKDLVFQAERFAEEAKAPPSTAETTTEIIAEEEKPETPQKDSVKFLVKKIRLEGNQLFDESDFREILAKFEDRRTSLEELKSLTQAITNHYRAYGFTTSRAYLPPQKMTGETLNVKIIEGKIQKVTVEGNKYFASAVYEDAIHLRQDRIFNYLDLASDLYFLNQKADIRAKAYLMAGEDPATSNIVLKAKEIQPLHAFYELHNRGTKLTHRARSTLRLDHNNLTGHTDTLNTALSLAEEGAFTAGFFSYATPLEDERTTLRLSGSAANSMVVKHLKPLEVKGEYLGLTPGISYAFIRRLGFQLEGLLSFEIKDSKTLVDDFKVDFDRLRIVNLGAQFFWQDASGKAVLVPQLHWGIPDFLGSSDSVDALASVPGTGGEFLYYTATAIRIQKIPGPSLVLVKASGQWTDDSLPSPEQFRAGGALSVRGYPESDAAGDYGYSLSAEWQWPAAFIPEGWLVPFSDIKWRDALRILGFLDSAKTFTRDRVLTTDVKDRFLLGTGVGIRLDVDRYFSLQTDWGFPLGDRSTDNDRSIFHVSLKAGF